jgi:hypothetical protein
MGYIPYLFTYGLFKYADSSSDYTALSGRMINKWCIRKDVEGSGFGLIATLSGIFLDEPRKPTEASIRIADIPSQIRNEHLPNATA